MKTITIALTSCMIGICGGYFTSEPPVLQTASVDGEPEAAQAPEPLPPILQKKTLAGDYLSSMFAQRHHDWTAASAYLKNVMKETPNETSLGKRAMVLAMGAGNVDTALSLAQDVAKDKDNNTLAELFLAVGAFHDKDYVAASKHIKAMPDGSLSEFIMPLLNSWAQAGVGIYDVDQLNKNTIHFHHAVLIADFLGKPSNIEPLLKKTVAREDLTIEDRSRIANLYAHLNHPEKAIEIYENLLAQWPNHPAILKKLVQLKKGEKPETLVVVKSPEEGIAAALYDMSNILYREYADDSARVFSQMALYLKPSLTDVYLLLAAIDARNERYGEAIRYYNKIEPANQYFMESRRRIADLMEETGDTEGALAQLNMLVKDHDDLESLIKIGDLYRRKEDFPKAIETYNRVAEKLGGTVPREHWNVLYIRGMSYERAGQWDKAEADLKASLVYQPDHPFVQNYLGYAWADQGIHLDEALDLIKKAATAQPNDGYIADSLGWVLYRMGKHGESLAHIERAIELLPYDPIINDHLGDAYWQAGRKREARFQWQRARNFSKSNDLSQKIDSKIANGLPVQEAVKEAHSQAEGALATP